MVDIEPADEFKLELPMLTLIVDGEAARREIARRNEGPRPGDFHEMVQAALLNAPDNPWRVNHVRVAFCDWEVAAGDRTGRSNWFTVQITEKPEPEDEFVHGLEFEVLANQNASDRALFRIRRVGDVTHISRTR